MDIEETAAVYETMNARNFDLVPWGHGYALDDTDALLAECYLQESPRNYFGIILHGIYDLYLWQSTELDQEAHRELVH